VTVYRFKKRAGEAWTSRHCRSVRGTMSEQFEGGCFCGAVRFNVPGTPTGFDLCHCSRCREAGGSAFLAELEFKLAEFEWVSGRSLIKPTRRQCATHRQDISGYSGRYVARQCRQWIGA